MDDNWITKFNESNFQKRYKHRIITNPIYHFQYDVGLLLIFRLVLTDFLYTNISFQGGQGQGQQPCSLSSSHGFGRK